MNKKKKLMAEQMNQNLLYWEELSQVLQKTKNQKEFIQIV